MKNEKDWWHKLSSVLTGSASKLVIIAALFYAIVAVNDNYIMHNVINHENQAIAASTYLVLGGWLITTGIAISNYAGAWILRLVKKNPKEKYIGFSLGTLIMQKYAASAGILAALNMICLLLAYQIMDPSLALALTTAVIVYLVIYDIGKPAWMSKILRKNPAKIKKEDNREKSSISYVIVSTILIIGGALLASVTKTSGEINLWGIFLVVIGASLFFAADNIVRYKVGSVQQESNQKFDDKTFVFWRAFWLSLFGTFLISIIAANRGYFTELWRFISNIWPVLLPFAVATVIGNYIFQILFQKALSMGTEKVSKITMLFMLQIVFGIVVSGIVYLAIPTAFGKDFPVDLSVWIARIIGMSFIIVGVFLAGKTRLGIRIIVGDQETAS
jgi:hypothetical protein